MIEASGAAFAVKGEIARAANGDPPPSVPRGLVVGGLHPPRENPRLLVTPVTLMLRDVSVLEALAELVLQVPGLGWAAREDTVLGGPERNARRPSCVLELLDQHGMTSSDVVLRPRRGPTR